MIIAHIAPFGPNTCGLYEAARDMCRADVLAGHQVYFIDAGGTSNGQRIEGKVGQVDCRCNFKLETTSPGMIDKSDIIIMHTGCYDNWIVKTDAPIIWMMHGRPQACFRPEMMGVSNAYSLAHDISKWKRTKAIVYFWKEFKPFWSLILNNKDYVIDYPVIDQNRFRFIQNNKSVLDNQGNINFLVCDSNREDFDNFELVNGLIYACEKYRMFGIKVHFYGMDFIDGRLPRCWDIIMGRLKQTGCLGDVKGRMPDMEKIYNSVDLLISPNKIITRTIAEAISCGIPVISQNNELNLVSDITCDMSIPNDMVSAFDLYFEEFRDDTKLKEKILKRSKVFSLENYNIKINELYKSIMEKKQ